MSVWFLLLRERARSSIALISWISHDLFFLEFALHCLRIRSSLSEADGSKADSLLTFWDTIECQ